jgi:outer membrane protein assembly factor BamB
MVGQGPAHRSQSPVATKDTPHRSWDFALPSNGSLSVAPVIASDGSVYLRTMTTLYSLSPRGDLRWSLAVASNLTDSGVNNTPAVAEDGTVYVGDGTTLDAVTPGGAVKWRVTASAERILGAPTVAGDGTVYVTSYGGDGEGLTAIGPDGSLRWTTQASRPSTATIAGDGTILAREVSDYVGSVTGFDATGRPSRPVQAKVGGAYDYDQLIVSAPDGSMFVSGDYGWEHLSAAGAPLSTPDVLPGALAMADDGSIYLGYGAKVLALGPDGASRWTLDLSSSTTYVGSVSLLADGTVYAGGDKQLFVVDASGTLVRTVDVGAPVSSFIAIDKDGTALFCAGDNVYAR